MSGEDIEAIISGAPRPPLRVARTAADMRAEMARRKPAARQLAAWVALGGIGPTPVTMAAASMAIAALRERP